MRFPTCVLLPALLALAAFPAHGADQPQWGEAGSRNMVSAETGLPANFDPATGAGIKWSVPLGNAYGSPTVAKGCVFIGSNNKEPRDPRHDGDRGVLLCLNEADGHLNWQLVVPRIADDQYKDWPMIGMCSPPTVEGDRVYTVTNRFEVVCLDIHGMANGNDGPFQDEGRHMAPADDPPMEAGPLDADILWVLDMPNDAGIWPHDSAHVSLLLDGGVLYANTGNGVDNTHAVIRRPDGPGLIAIDKHTGKLLARDPERMAPVTFHATWSSPSMGVVAGEKRIFFGGGDGILYAFQPRTLERIWAYDGDPTAPKTDVAQYLRNREVSPSNIKGMPVFHDGKVYVTLGGDIWWGKEKAWLKCVNAANGAEVWSYEMGNHSAATPAIAGGLAYVTDCDGAVHCLDAATGAPCWTHDLGKETWGSTLVADGKVYVGSRGGDLVVFQAAREKQILAEIDLGDVISATPTAANGVLYVNTLKRLYAVGGK